MVEFPAWVMKWKTTGVEIRRLNNAFYAYKISSKWDAAIGRARKVTLAYLGKVTPEGIIASKHERILQDSRITSKEVGASLLLQYLTQDLQAHLREVYPHTWQAIYAVAMQRLVYAAPLKNMQMHFATSALADEFKNVSLVPRQVSELLRSVGADRDAIVAFLHHLQGGGRHVLVDLTAIFSQAEHLSYLAPGHNSAHSYEPHVNLLLLFGADQHAPTYYRLLPGSIPDVSSIRLTLVESGVNNALFIGDKGFYSATNVALLDEQHLEYVLPLRRNNTAIDYKAMLRTDKRGFGGYFLFHKRPIWYHTQRHGKHTIILYLDERLRTDEQQTLLGRIAAKTELTLHKFHEHTPEYGTIAIITNTKQTPQECYEHLKSRLQIETAFDALKNILEADRTYMRTDHHLEGWFFVNFLALTTYYTLFNRLQHYRLLTHYSPKDVIAHFSKVHKITINGRALITEMPKTTRELMKKLDIPENILQPIPQKTQS